MKLWSLRAARRSGVALVAGVVITVAGCSESTSTDASSSEVVARDCATTLPAEAARVAAKVNGRKSQQTCYRFVKADLRAVGASTAELEGGGFGRSAAMFAEFAQANPAGLARMGLTKLEDPSLDALPKGAILVWHRGQCGYDKTHGHIEIVMDDRSSRACSDFCGNIKKTCGLPDVFVFARCPGAASNPGNPDLDDAEGDGTSEAAPTQQ